MRPNWADAEEMDARDGTCGVRRPQQSGFGARNRGMTTGGGRAPRGNGAPEAAPFGAFERHQRPESGASNVASFQRRRGRKIRRH
jgi:hypothetical protein